MIVFLWMYFAVLCFHPIASTTYINAINDNNIIVTIAAYSFIYSFTFLLMFLSILN